MSVQSILTDVQLNDHVTHADNIAGYDAHVSVYFSNIEQNLIAQIRDYPVIVGAVSWITNLNILSALAECQAVSILVQKENYLKRTSKNSKNSKNSKRNHSYEDKLLDAYDRLKCDITLDQFESFENFNNKNVQYTGSIQPIRCVGNQNAGNVAAFPKMHNKFIVMCYWEYVQDASTGDIGMKLRPEQVITGSFNFTNVATASLENIVVINSVEIARAYLIEYAQILTISEPLEWTSEIISPEK